MNIKKITPRYTTVVTTMHKYAVDEVSDAGLVTDTNKLAGTIKEFQTVVSVGSSVRGIKEGDLVCINPEKYAVHKFRENSIKGDLMENQVTGYRFTIVELDHIPHLMLQDTDIMYVIDEWEEDPKWDSALVMPDTSVIDLTK